VSAELLNGGGPVVVTSQRDRIGQGPWARLFSSATVRDESSSTAERGRVLARGGHVHGVSVAKGEIAARVAESDGGEHSVTFAAAPVPPRIWATVFRSARGREQLEAAVEGRQQSVQLTHVMSYDWEEPLVPQGPALRRACTCPAEGACEHLVAVAYVVADAIDNDPSLLLRWRGCDTARPDAHEAEEAAPVPVPPRSEAAGDPWQAGPLPPPRPLRPLPVGAILKCLGPSGLRVGSGDLADVLQRAYASFAGSERR
jgi:uncharacterized Zn finger protein